MTQLFASPDVLVIDRQAGQQTGTAHITYSARPGDEPRLWERIVGAGPWVRVDLKAPRILSSPSGDPQVDGQFSQTLSPGQVYQVVMYSWDDFDPNEVDPNGPSRRRADGLVTVIAVLKDPESRELVTSQDQNVGGTWFRKTVSTVQPTTFTLQVSSDPPFVDADGIERFVAPLGTFYGTDLATSHDGQVEPLLPGNDLFSLTRVVDEVGNWQTLEETIRTRRRKVTIEFDKLHIINDGANGDTTAEFRIWVVEGEAAVKGFFFGDVDTFEITDRPSPGEEHKELIPIGTFCPPFTIGPKDVTDSTYRVSILTRGLCWRAFGANDYTSNFRLGDEFPGPKTSVPHHASFRFPTGDHEQVNGAPFSVRTRQQVVDVEFEYAVFMRVTVTYH